MDKNISSIKRAPVISCVILLSILLLAAFSLAHPHTFIEVEIKAVFEGNSLAGLKVEWLFDYMTAVNINTRYDKNSDLKLDPQEIETLRDESFYGLGRFNFYTDIKLDGQSIVTPWPTDFQLREPGNQMVYSFYVPLDSVADSNTRLISVSSYDKEFFCDMDIKKTVELENVGSMDVTIDYSKDKSRAYYFDQIVPLAVNIRIN